MKIVLGGKFWLCTANGFYEKSDWQDLNLITNLNPGMGDPCAGQVRAKEEDKTSDKPLMLSFEANFGMALPIGSTKVISVCAYSYLKPGMGDPWAGQVRANVESKISDKTLMSSFAANFGSALPMGSKAR